MKKSYKFLLYSLYFFLSITYLNASDLYWIGGSGNWGDPSHWSTTSGGSSGLLIPDSSTRVIIDNNSSTQDFNININSNAALSDFEVSSSYLVSIKGSSNIDLSVYGSISWNDQVNNEFQGEISLLSKASQNNLVDFSDKLIHGKLSFTGSGSWAVINSFWAKDIMHFESGNLLISNSFVITNEFSANSSKTQTFELQNSQFFVDSIVSTPSTSISFKYDRNSYTNYFSISSKAKAGPTSKAITGFVVDQEDVSCFGFNDGKAWIDTITYTGTSGPYTYLWKRFSNNNTVSTTDTAKNLEGGLYSIRITDLSNNSFSQQFVTIDEPSEIGTLIFVTDETCRGDCDGSIMVATTGGTTPYTYLWSNSQTGSTATNLCDGQYELTITDANGCIRLDTAIVEEPPLIQPNVTTTNVDCHGNCNGTASSSPSGGTGTYIMYEWSTGQSGAALSSISGLCAGNYSVTITDSDTCKNVENFSITEPSAPLSASLSVTDAACFGQASGSITLSPAGGTSPYTYQWSDASPSQNRSNIAAGTYYVTITDDNSCTYLDTAVVGQPTKISISFSSIVDVFCNGDSTGSAQASPSGGTSPYVSYQWSNGDIGTTAIKLPAGFHTVTVTDANGCTGVDSVEITEPTQVAVNIDLQQNPKCNGSSDGIINTTPSGGTSPYSYAWSDGPSTAEDRTSMPSDAYTFTLTDANGCSIVENVSLTDPALLTVLIDSIEAVSCNGGADGFARALGSGGTGSLNYSWSNSVNGRNNPNLMAGNYTVTVTDANNCTATAVANILQPSSALSASATKTDASCQGVNDGTATANGSGGTTPYSFSWTGGATTKTITGLSTGSYTVTITDNNGCSDEATVVINQPAAVSVGIDSKNLRCFNDNSGTAEANASGGTSPYTYLWSDNQSSKKAINLSAGSYSVTVTDANGCTGNASVGISEPTQLSASINSHTEPSCNGGSDGTATVSASGGTAAYTYQWNDASNQTTQTANGLTAGSYSVTVTDDSLCTTTASIIISEPSAISIIDTIYHVKCFGNSDGGIDLFVSGGTSPYSYNWSSGQSSSSISGLAAGNYNVTVTDDNGCARVGMYTVNQPSLLSVNVNGSNVSCYGDSTAVLSSNVSGGSTPYSYQWSSGQTTSPISGMPAGSYTLTVTDANNCTASDSYTVTQPQDFTVNLVSSINPLCFNAQTGELGISVSGGISPYTYVWDDPSMQTNDTARGLGAGTYSVTITDANNCEKDTSFTLTEPDSLTLNIDSLSHILCNGQNDGYISISVSGGTSPYSYLWSNSQTGTILNNLSAGSYTVTVTDANNCQKSRSIIITEPSALNLSFTVSNVSCPGNNDGSVTANPSGGTSPYTYLWSNNSTTKSINNLSAGVYSVTISDANSCSIVDSATVTEPNAITTSISSTDVSCFGLSDGSASVSASGGSGTYTYFWIPNFATTSSINNLSAGMYVVIVSDSKGCSKTDTVIINEPDSISINLNNQDNISCNGLSDGSISIAVSGGSSPYTYLWSNNDTSSLITNLSAGNYTVTVTDDNSCQKSRSFNITEPLALKLNLDSLENVSCNAGSDALIHISVTGGITPYTYSWSNSSTNQDQNNLSAGIYSVTITDDNNCTYDTSFSISEPAALSVSFNTTDVDCYGNNTGSISTSVSGGTSPYNYNWSNSDTTSGITNLVAGVYALTLTDANNCSFVDSVAIIQPNTFSFIDSVSNNQCFGDCDGIIGIYSFSGGVSPYQFSWSSNVNNSNSGSTYTEALGLCNGNYSLTITDDNGCDTVLNFNITSPTAITANLSSTLSHCAIDDGTATATPSGGVSPYSYNWLGISQNTQTVTGLDAGSYQVEITDANFCKDTFSVNVADTASPVVSLSSMDASCFGAKDGMAIANSRCLGAGVCTIEWLYANGSSTNVFNDTLIDSAGTYISKVTYKGCSSYDTISINSPLNIKVISNIQDQSCGSTCNGFIKLTASGGASPYTYSWSPSSVSGQGTDSIFNLCMGSYSVTITDANGCIYDSSFTIAQPNTLNISFSQTNVDCNNANTGSVTTTVSGGTAPYTYAWSNSATAPSISNLSAGMYVLTVTDNNNCSKVDTVNISEPSAFSFIDSLTNNRCFGDCFGSIEIFGFSGGVAPYQFNWSSNVSSFNTGSNYTNAFSLCAGNYSLTISDANGCDTVLNYQITTPKALVGNITSTFSHCNVDDGTATANISGGVSPYSYDWLGLSQNTQTATGLDAGIYFVEITDASFCRDTFSVAVNDSLGPQISLSFQDASCHNSRDGIAIANSLCLMAGTCTIEWFYLNGISTNVFNDTLIDSAGSYISKVDFSGCVSFDTITIGSPLELLANLNIIDQNCGSTCNGSVKANTQGGTPPYTYDWSPAGVSGQGTDSIFALCKGNYSLTITDANNCEFINNFVVDSSSFSVDLNKTDVSCNGANDGSITSNISGGFAPYTFNWSGGLSGENPTNVSEGIYLLTVTDNFGCMTMDTIGIDEPDSLKATTNLTKTSDCFTCDGSATLNPTGGTAPYSYEWFDFNFTSIGVSSKTATQLCALNYFAVITDANSCKDTVFIPAGYSNPVMTFTTKAENCTGSCDGSVTISSPCTNCSYELLDLNGNVIATSTSSAPITFNNLCSGQFIIREYESVNGCSSADTITIGSNTSFDLTLTSIDALCNNTNTGSISSSITGGTAPYNYSWSGGLSGANPLNVAAGTYNVTVTDNVGCVGTASVQVNEPAAISYSSTTTNSSCNSSDGTATVFPSGGTGNIQVEWLDNNKNSIGQNTATANNLSAGIYYAALMDDNSCVDTVTVLVNDANGPDANIFFSNESCANSCDGSVSVKGDCITDGTCTVVWTNSTGQIVGTSDSIPNLCADDYFATLTDTAGCISILRTSVGGAVPITASLGSTNTSCISSACLGTAYVIANGGTGNLTYEWFDINNNSMGTNDTLSSICNAGIYFVDISDQNGCSERFSVAVSDSTASTFSLNTTDVSCGGSCDGTASVNITCNIAVCQTRWYDANGLAVDSFKTSINGLCAGDYYVEVINGSGCKSIQKFSIGGSDVIQVNASITHVECNSLSSGSINLTTSGGSGGYSYIWSPAPGNGQGTNSVSGLSAGTYYVSVSDNSNCMLVDTFEVIEPSAISVNFNSNDANCGSSNGAVAATVSGGTTPYNYQWFDGSNVLLVGETTANLSNVSSGSYRLRVRDNNSCEQYFNTVINDSDGPNIDLDSIVDVICFGANSGEINISVSGSGPFSYNWLPNGLGTEDVKNLTAGKYTVIVEDQNACVSSETYDITESNEITANFQLSESECGNCNGQAVINVSGGLAPYTYLWSNASSSDTAINLCAGIYTVKVTDANSCTKTFNVNINNSDGISGANVLTTASCFNSCNGTASVTPVGGTAPYTYLWLHNSSTQNSLSNLCSGTYYVQITDANSCNRIEEIVINSPSANLSVSEIVNPVSCSGSACDGSIFVNVSGGMPPYSYSWLPGSFADTNYIGNLCQGTYYLTVSDANSCTVVKSIYLNSDGDFPEPNAIAENESCFNACDAALMSDMTATSLYSYQWLNAAGTAIAPVNTNLSSGVCAGMYSLEITELSSGCQNFHQVEVEAADSILILPSIINPISCANDCDGAINLSVIGGELLYSYIWDDPNSQTTNPAVGLCAGTYNVTVTDANSCEAFSSMIISAPNPLEVSIDNFTGVNCSSECDGTANSSVSGGTPPYTFSWNAGQNVQNPTDLCFGMNILTVTDAKGCSVMDTVLIPAQDTVNVLVNSDQVICEVDSIYLSADVSGPGNIDYAWYEMPGNIFLTQKLDTTFTRNTGSYEFIFVATNGTCTDTGRVNVTVNESPIIDAGNTITLFDDEVERINLNGADVSYMYVWTPAEGLSDSSIASPIASTRETTMYLITVTTVDGCIARDSVLVIYNPDLAVPSGFTPNGDGVNDVWEIDIIAERFPNAELTIFNRWGEELYRSVGYGKPWDGTYNGKNLPVGTYYFVLDLKDNAYENITGPITIMR